MSKIVLMAALAACMAVAACNTVSGAGKDVSSAGHAVTDTANDAKH
jgi:predicted small secreted protein